MVSNTNDATLTAAQNKCKDKNNFNFIEVDQQKIEKEILKLDVNKASQSFDIPIKVVIENTNSFSNFFCNNFNNSIKLSTFHGILKHANIIHLYKKVKKIPKETKDKSAFFQIYQKYLKNACQNKCHNFAKIYCRNIIVSFARDLVPSRVFW